MIYIYIYIYTYEDNISIIHNTATPESTLKKTYNPIIYHFIIEGVAKIEWLIIFTKSKHNIADVLTNPLPPPLRELLFKIFMYYIYD